jgi:hypothetical protein
LRFLDPLGQLALTFFLDDELCGFFLIRKDGKLKMNTLTSIAV